MRRTVRDYIAAALIHQRPELEQFIAEHLECPEALRFAGPTVAIEEIRAVAVTPRVRADFPLVNLWWGDR
ncbi:MAG: hypothetical protein ACYDAB_08185 [bacterium]